MLRQALPRRGDALSFAANPAAGPGQPAVDLALVFKNVEVSPDQLLGVVVAESFLLIAPKSKGYSTENSEEPFSTPFL